MFLDKFKEYISNFKNKEKEGNNKKTIENLAFFAVILIVTIVIINYIWNKDNKDKSNISSNTKILASTEKNNLDKDDSNYESKNVNINSLESDLENILKHIKGVGNVKVLITYSKTSEAVPMYNEDSSSTTTEETDTSGGVRKIIDEESKKDIIYQEENGFKIPVLKSTTSPIIEGAIITAKGANNAEVKSNIIQAVEAATGLATHKIKVFESES